MLKFPHCEMLTYEDGRNNCFHQWFTLRGQGYILGVRDYIKKINWGVFLNDKCNVCVKGVGLDDKL